MSKAVALSRAYRLAVASRVLAAAFGGYALASAATVLLALVWPAPQSQALLWASMLSFAIYSVAVIWVFMARTATRAWVGLVLVTAAVSALAWLLRTGGAA
ncbi:DUF3649 domain-containing protein [Pantoea sp. 18069]|uniref:DUF3649 domain-containing protein n=1 Tax=Pantoea sp. 18069 TaxID=2681415 RepID=UPI00135718CE|nr:DUF3649 domain-containing protein [Pantoea sp. 18069]